MTTPVSTPDKVEELLREILEDAYTIGWAARRAGRDFYVVLAEMHAGLDQRVTEAFARHRIAHSRPSGMGGRVQQSATVRRIVGPTILLASGEYFDFLDPESCAFDIGDIAHGLSHICRFAGHCRNFYSVAQHSVYVSQLVPPEHAFAALMHDAAEAFVGDVAKPLKDLLLEYRVIEGRVEAALFAHFGIEMPLHPSIKEADIVMLATEQLALMQNRDDWEYTRGRKPADLVIDFMPPPVAKSFFLDRFAKLAALQHGDSKP